VTILKKETKQQKCTTLNYLFSTTPAGCSRSQSSPFEGMLVAAVEIVQDTRNKTINVSLLRPKAMVNVMTKDRETLALSVRVEGDLEGDPEVGVDSDNAPGTKDPKGPTP